MFLRYFLHSLLFLLLHALLTVGLVIVILPNLCSHCCFHIWPLKRSLSSTSFPHGIWTARSHILLLLYPLSHNSLNVIRTKWWSSTSILFVPFVSCRWTFLFNHSWWLIRKPYSSCLCTILQRYFQCEWTISIIHTTTHADQQRAFLKDSFSVRCCSWMSRHALATHPSIILY